MEGISQKTKNLLIICMDVVGCMSCPIQYNSDDCKEASSKMKELQETEEGLRYLEEIKY